jgi:hypothetical protein
MSTTKIHSTCRIANIGPDDAMILAHAANPDGSNFRKGQVFDNAVEYDNFLGVLPKRKIEWSTAQFRQVKLNEPHAHHDALEFPDGQIVLLTRLCEGQYATVLQLPANPSTTDEVNERTQDSLIA